ncbi:hypothetical protein MIMGU_mgv1a007083mg [Erythranthe guttata]|uniref:PB1 domain-containing protein n=1 Tax=Erythranthe guttata TaxID=4155 RepID=A0A022RX27_ERYGU|nr:hypothetical protein MIMGU_mgv1a007083mg [Erythranthe guttata]
MEPLPPPPSATPTPTAISPRPPIPPCKLRLMCSYGGHIVPRPHDKSLFYAGGETRIVAVDRRTAAASLSALSAHLSRAIFQNRPFNLKYQLPDEDLDSLISVIADEDLAIMLEEHDRITPAARIRLFLFPVKPESVGSALLDPKSESWFCDALKGTRMLQKGHEISVGTVAAAPKTGIFQEPLIQVDPDQSTEYPVSDPSFSVMNQKTSQVLGYPLSQLPDGNKQQLESQFIQGGLQYVHQYAGPMPISPYYPMYQMPMHHHPQHISGTPNQQYPVYFMPVRPTQYYNMPMPSISYDANHANASSRPPLHPLSPVIAQTVDHKEVFVGQIAESGKKLVTMIPFNQDQLVVGPTEDHIASEQVTNASVLSAVQGGEFDEDIAYNLIYKSQPSPPLLPSQYQMTTKGTPMLSEPSVQLLHPQ